MNVRSWEDKEVFQAEAAESTDIGHYLVGQGLRPTIISCFGDLVIYHLKIIYYHFAGFQEQAAAAEALLPGGESLAAGKIIERHIGSGPRT